MSHLKLLQGLPGSGKTTRAMELLKTCGNAVRLNRDSLRTMMHGDIWSPKKEAITVSAMHGLACSLLANSDVGVLIIDDTNLNNKVVDRWKAAAHDWGVSFDIERMTTPLEECIIRDAKRERSVGRHVILGMAMQYGLYPCPQKGIVICDIDGTLANCDHRLHFAQQEPKDWVGFFDAMSWDTPRQEVIDQIVQYQEEGYEIFLVSGRPESHRNHTFAWLVGYCPQIVYEALFMRQTHDHRPDVIIKQEILDRYFPDRAWIHRVVDDRPMVLRMWREAGLQVVDVGKGEEF